MTLASRGLYLTLIFPTCKAGLGESKNDPSTAEASSFSVVPELPGQGALRSCLLRAPRAHWTQLDSFGGAGGQGQGGRVAVSDLRPVSPGRLVAYGTKRRMAR